MNEKHQKCSKSPKRWLLFIELRLEIRIVITWGVMLNAE